nr:MAG TPA_asm: hypothetical protein [Caudoviricetes sp.]
MLVQIQLLPRRYKDHSVSGLFSYIKKPLEMGSSG